LDYENAKKIGAYMGVRHQWLLEGTGDSELIDEARITPHLGEPSRDDSDIGERDKIVVRQLDLRFGMGSGGIYDAPVEAQGMSFSRAWIRQLTNAPFETLFWASGFGDSMHPTIADGDIVLVDSSQDKPRMFDQIWAINQYGHGMIKRLRPTENGYILSSDNPTVKDIIAIDGTLEVVGRIVAIVRKV
jgi:phage repressor protein C with HTH and peptisase S24 domain